MIEINYIKDYQTFLKESQVLLNLIYNDLGKLTYSEIVEYLKYILSLVRIKDKQIYNNIKENMGNRFYIMEYFINKSELFYDIN